MEKRDAADPALQGFPEGWQLVPVEPDRNMVQASIWALDRWREKNGNVQGFVPPGEKYQIRWRAMLGAAPTAPTDDRLAKLDSSWRETLTKERAIHLNEVRLKDEFRTRALVAESELARVTAQRDDLLAGIQFLSVPLSR
jgi:hypothetical protein